MRGVLCEGIIVRLNSKNSVASLTSAINNDKNCLSSLNPFLFINSYRSMQFEFSVDLWGIYNKSIFDSIFIKD